MINAKYSILTCIILLFLSCSKGEDYDPNLLGTWVLTSDFVQINFQNPESSDTITPSIVPCSEIEDIKCYYQHLEFLSNQTVKRLNQTTTQFDSMKLVLESNESLQFSTSDNILTQCLLDNCFDVEYRIENDELTLQPVTGSSSQLASVYKRQ